MIIQFSSSPDSLHQSSPEGAVLHPLLKGKVQIAVLMKSAAELWSTISQYDTKYQNHKEDKHLWY